MIDCILLYRYWWNTRIFPFTKKSYLHRAQWRYYFYLSRVRILVSPWLLTWCCVLCRNFISIHKINRTLHGRLGIRILSSSAESISHEWAKRTSERYFQHSKIKFVSPRGHVISSISITTIKLRMNWSGMIYFPTGSSDFTMILGCMT